MIAIESQIYIVYCKLLRARNLNTIPSFYQELRIDPPKSNATPAKGLPLPCLIRRGKSMTACLSCPCSAKTITTASSTYPRARPSAVLQTFGYLFRDCIGSSKERSLQPFFFFPWSTSPTRKKPSVRSAFGTLSNKLFRGSSL